MTTGPLGSFALLLHAHLPFVRHPEHDDFLEEDWLFEALTESYLPLIRMMRRLREDGVVFRLAMSLTPTLCAMLRDELLQQRYLRHLERLIGLAAQETGRNRHHPQLHSLAQFYRDFFAETRTFFQETLARDVVRAFRELQETGSLEIIASAATHGFLPLLKDFPEAQRAQIRIGCDSYREMFGREPSGFWLPECGYSDGLDALLAEANIRWFVLDTHGLMFARPRPRFAIFAPCYTPAGPAFFARDGESSREVWSAQSGYPGDPVYRDFYRDAGFDRSDEELRPFVRPRGIRKFSGIKYHRVSGQTDEKEFYDRNWALAAADEHARDFLEKREERFRELSEMNFDGIVVSPFDAELFGHWWFEGPRFLETFIREAAAPNQTSFQLATPTEFLAANLSQQVVRPNPSSWGENGFNSVWLSEENAWIYRHLHGATRRMIEIARAQREPVAALSERALRQAARELLLAQSSDWAFLMKNQTAPQYAEARTREHLLRFNRLYEQLRVGSVDQNFLGECEARTPIFPNLHWRYYL
ncbi:MAG TPA: 1,4-alpha-glucan branching protein domain-containing protein [Chthoniobacterales bacterium]|nr:1,4-alpha-glucan branching protein domain-containing protein [Chthoniobacterales bacterium]